MKSLLKNLGLILMIIGAAILVGVFFTGSKLNLNKFVGIFMFLVHVRDCKDTHIYKKGTYKLKKEYDLIG